MTCKEKWGLTPNEILKLNFGLRDGKGITHLEMKIDAINEINELKNLKSIKCFSQSYEQIKINRINELEKSNCILYPGDEAVYFYKKY